MRRNLSKLLFLLFTFSFFLPISVSADGGLFPPPNFYVGHTDQKAVIFHDQGVETLIISITFQGNAKDFGWVVPTPTKPEVDKSSDELFLALEELTRKPIIYQDKGLMPTMLEGSVEVLETKEVGIYEIKILKADDPKALSSWLNENGYNFPQEASYILEDYIKNKWYFTAVKVRPGLVWQGVEDQLRSGHATPLKLVFKSEQIVYPLKITSVARYFSPPVIQPSEEEKKMGPEMIISRPGGSMGVLLYVFTNCEKDLPGFSVLYAEEIEEKEIEDLAYNDDGTPWIEPKADFILTKLHRTMQPVEMTNDLILRDKTGGIKITPKPEPRPTKEPTLASYLRPLFEKSWLKPILLILIFSLLLISPIGLIFIFGGLIHFFAKSEMGRIVALVFQGFSFLLWFLLMVFFGAARFGLLKEELVILPEKAFSLCLSSGVLLFLLMTSVLFFQVKSRRD